MLPAGDVVATLLPALTLLPYTSLSAESRTNTFTLYGYSHLTGNRDGIVVLESPQWPEYDPSFRLTLDWRGRAVLDVRHAVAETRAEGSNTYYLPFEATRFSACWTARVNFPRRVLHEC